jgi:phosphoglycolate phosphatase-like HAD superfamily hydrolase
MLTTCVIFDIDGTLVDSDGFEEALYTAAVRDVFSEVRIRPHWDDYEHVTDAGIALQICKDNELEISSSLAELRTRFGELVSAYLRTKGPCTPLPGALKFWNSLRDNENFRVGIATGGWGHTARMKLESAGFLYAGVALASSDDALVRAEIMECCRRLLSPTDSTIYIGDGEWDQVAAKRLGWDFIGVGNRLRGKRSKWIPDFASADQR